MTAEIIPFGLTDTPEDCPLTREAVWEVNYGADEACTLCGARPESHEVGHPDWSLERFRLLRGADW